MQIKGIRCGSRISVGQKKFLTTLHHGVALVSEIWVTKLVVWGPSPQGPPPDPHVGKALSTSGAINSQLMTGMSAILETLGL